MRPSNNFLISFLLSFLLLCVAYNYGTEKHVWCSFLISIYMVLYIGVMRIYSYFSHVTMFFLGFLTFVRYFIIPVLICIDEDFLSYEPLDGDENSKFFVSGILFTMWESLFLGLYLLNRLPHWYQNNDNQKTVAHYKSESVGLLAVEMLLMVLLVLISPGILGKYSFMFNLDGNDMISMSDEASVSLLDTIALMGARILKTLLPIPFLFILYKKYQYHNKLKYFLLSSLILIIFYALIMEGNSRNSIIIPAISIIFIMSTLFPKYKRGIWTSMIVIIAIISVLSIIFKVFRNDIAAAMEADTLSYWISYLDIYFAGISNMGRVVSAKLIYGDEYNNFLLMINDLFSNIPLLSKFTDDKYSSLYLFLKFWDRNDQVIPSSGNGLFYFGYFLAPVVPVLIATLAHFFEKKRYESMYLTEYVVYTFACATISYNIFNQVSSLMMKLFITVMPIVIIISINKKWNINNLRVINKNEKL